MAKSSYELIVKIQEFTSSRPTDKTLSPDQFGPLSRSTADEWWIRSMCAQSREEAAPERTVANMIEGSANIVF